MSGISNNITTTNTQPASQPVKKEKVAFQNSIHGDGAVSSGSGTTGATTQTTQNATEQFVNEFTNSILNELKAIGVEFNFEELKEFIYSMVDNLTPQELQALQKQNGRQFRQCVRAARTELEHLADANGKIDKSKVKALVTEYYIAVKLGWNLKEYQEAVKDPKNQLSINDVIKQYLPEDADPNNPTPEQKKNAIKQFCIEQLGKLNSKDVDKATVQNQLKHIALLLRNTSDADKALIAEVIKELNSENQLDAIKMLFASFDDEKMKQELSTYYQTNLLKITSTKGKSWSKEMTQELMRFLAKNDSPEARAKAQEILKTQRTEWYEQNQALLDSAHEKIRAAKEQGVKPELTPEEEQVLIEEANFIIAGSQGEMIGLAQNQNISHKMKTDMLCQLNESAFSLDAYTEILQGVNNYIKNPENQVSEDLVQLLNKTTSGNLEIAASGEENPKFNEPIKVEPQNEETKTPALGFSTPTVETPKVQTESKIQQLYSNTDDQASFRVDKNVTPTINKKQTILEEYNTASTARKKAIFNNACLSYRTTIENQLTNYLKRSSNPVQVLKMLPFTMRTEVAINLVEAGKLDAEDVEKLNLPFSYTNLVEKSLEKQEERRA